MHVFSFIVSHHIGKSSTSIVSDRIGNFQAMTPERPPVAPSDPVSVLRSICDFKSDKCLLQSAILKKSVGGGVGPSENRSESQ